MTPTTTWVYVPVLYWTAPGRGVASVASAGARHDKQADAEAELATMLGACTHVDDVHGVVERWLVRT